MHHRHIHVGANHLSQSHLLQVGNLERKQQQFLIEKDRNKQFLIEKDQKTIFDEFVSKLQKAQLLVFEILNIIIGMYINAF